MDSRVSVLFVCMGNICRSPTAEGVFRAVVERDFPQLNVEIDSAGTHAYHVGDPPDHRAQDAAARRGYDLSPIRARRVSSHDFINFHHIIAMDEDNLALLRRHCPAGEEHRLELFLAYHDGADGIDVPDPYYGGAGGFEHVLDLAEAASVGLAESLITRAGANKKRPA